MIAAPAARARDSRSDAASRAGCRRRLIVDRLIVDRLIVGRLIVNRLIVIVLVEGVVHHPPREPA